MQIHTVAMFGNVFGVDGLVLIVIGILIFGRRLPEIGKNIGQTIVEFKKGLNGKGLETPTDEEPEKNVASNRNIEQRQGRVSATSSPSRPAKTLPSTEEV